MEVFSGIYISGWAQVGHLRKMLSIRAQGSLLMAAKSRQDSSVWGGRWIYGVVGGGR